MLQEALYAPDGQQRQHATEAEVDPHEDSLNRVGESPEHPKGLIEQRRDLRVDVFDIRQQGCCGPHVVPGQSVMDLFGQTIQLNGQAVSFLRQAHALPHIIEPTEVLQG